MKIYQLLEIVVLAYSVFVIMFTIFMAYFRFKNRKHYTPVIKTNYEVSLILNKLRGKTTILLPLKIFSVIFLISWLLLAYTFIDYLFGINLTTNLVSNNLYTCIGTFSDIEFSYYFLILFLSTAIGTRGHWLVSTITNILSDTSLSVDPDGKLDYNKKIN